MLRLALTVASLFVTADLLAQPAPLTPGRAVRAALASGDTARYRVDLEANSLARLTVDQLSVDVRVRVLNAGGQVVTGANGAQRGQEHLQFESAAPGSFQVQVIPVGEAGGDFAITLVRREPLATDPRRLADQLLAPYDRRDSPGAAVAVWRGGRTLFAKAYGMANLTHEVPFTVTTPTNIGSTSKQFTAFAIMLLAEQGKLSLDDDVRKHIPELPDLGTVVTIRHLLTHTSGYRELYNAILIEGRRIDYGDHIERDELIRLVQRQPTLQNAPGAEFNYNNTGYGLAALIVERVSGQSFPDYMAEHVFGPLGMRHTMVRASSRHIVPGRSEGYLPGDGDGWRVATDLSAAMGAGSIYSTVSDLQRWVENFSRPRVGASASLEAMMTPFTLADGKSTGYGFGLLVDTQGALKRVHHGGADIAHRSQLVYYPEIDAGITVQSNHAGFDTGVAFRLAKAFFSREMDPPAVAAAEATFDPATYDATRFDEFVGRYALDNAPAFVLTFTRAGDTLYTQATGQQRFPIYPTSDSTFALRVVEASVSFHRNAEGVVTHATLHQGGAQRATRLVGEAAPTWKPSVEELRAFEGRYFSEEFETFYTVRLVDSSLVAEHRRLEPVTMAPGEVDTFAAAALGAPVTIAFERDRVGRVIGFYIGSGRTRDVRFARVR